MFPYMKLKREFILDCETVEYGTVNAETINRGHKPYGLTRGCSENCKACTGYSGFMMCDRIQTGVSDPCKDCSSISRLVGWLIENINLANWGRSVRPSEIKAWCQSLGIFIHDILKDDNIPNEIAVGLEYYADNDESCRADVILAGYGVNNTDTIMVIELKQYSGLEFVNPDPATGQFQEMISYKPAGSRCWGRNEKNVAMRVNDYKDYIVNSLAGSVYKPDVITCAYLHNLIPGGALADGNPTLRPATIKVDRNNIVTDPKILGSTGTKFFMRWDNNEPGLKLKEYIASVFPAGNNAGKDGRDILRRIKKESTVYGTEKLAEQLVNGCNARAIPPVLEEKLHSDQRAIFQKLRDHITGPGNYIDVIYGAPGSGKTLLTVMLMIENPNAYFVYTGAASRNKIIDSTNHIYSTTPALRKIITSLRSRFIYFDGTLSGIRPDDIVIFDEFHRFDKGAADLGLLIGTRKNMIILADKRQVICEADNGINVITAYSAPAGYIMETHSLWSQFRCNRDEGAVRWIEQVFDMKNEENSVFEKEDVFLDELDFGIELVSDLRVFLTDPRAQDCYCVSEQKGFWSTLGLNPCTTNKGLLKPLSGGTGEVGDVFDVQGVEGDKVLVLIGDDLVFDSTCEKVRLGDGSDYMKLLSKLRVATDGNATDRDALIRESKLFRYSPTANYMYSTIGDKNLCDDIRVKIRSMVFSGAANIMDDQIKMDKSMELLKNRYRILLTRGLKECYIYCHDDNLRKHLMHFVKKHCKS